jgi:hypothetical protein
MKTSTLAELRRQALAQNIQIRRTPAGFVARGSGIPCGPGDLVARTPDELRAVLSGWLGGAA